MGSGEIQAAERSLLAPLCGRGSVLPLCAWMSEFEGKVSWPAILVSGLENPSPFCFSLRKPLAGSAGLGSR